MAYLDAFSLLIVYRYIEWALKYAENEIGNRTIQAGLD